MAEQVDLTTVSEHILATLFEHPVYGSTRFTLADELIDRYPSMVYDEALFLIGRALAALQELDKIAVLRPESWDRSGDEPIRLKMASH